MSKLFRRRRASQPPQFRVATALATIDQEPAPPEHLVPDGPKVDGYVINLDSRPENLRRFKEHMTATGLVPNAIRLERLPAVDMTGVRLDGREAATKKIHPDKMRKLRDHVSRRAIATMVVGKRRYHEQFTSGGAVGCYLSHVEFWRKVAALPDNHRGAVIMEDDARSRHPELLGALLHTIADQGLPRDVDVLLLGWVNLNSVDAEPGALVAETPASSSYPAAFAVAAEPGIEPGPSAPVRLSEHVVGHRVVRPFGCTHMYFLTPRGARKLLETAFPIEVQVDYYMGQRLDAKLSELLGIDPLVVYGARTDLGESLVAQHNPTGSSISHGDCSGCEPFYDRRVPWVASPFAENSTRMLTNVGVTVIYAVLIAVAVVAVVALMATRIVRFLQRRKATGSKASRRVAQQS